MTELIEWLAGWYNWLFLLSMFAGLLFIIADVALGGISDMIGVDGGGDLDVDADLAADVDLDGPDAAAVKVGGAFVNGLAWVGLGKVPMSVLIEVLLLSFGCTGLLVNSIIFTVWKPLAPFGFPLALAAACVVAPAFTKVTGKIIAKAIPADSTTSKKPAEFVGEIGVAASRITRAAGQVRIPATDTHPFTILNARLSLRVADGVEAVARGQEVYLAEYDDKSNAYHVVPTERN